MAFSNRIGSFVKQSLTQSNVSMLNAVRCMSSKLFVGGLSFQTDDYSLREAFSGFGEVTEAKVITDRDSGRSRGFGFVSFTTDDSAKEAISAMDGQELNGRSIRVNLANEQPLRGGGGGDYNRNFGGGY